MRKTIEFKRKFSLLEMYQAVVYLPWAIVKLIGNNRKKLVDQKFIERMNLAVTEVNGCAACSYAHTKMALSQGMSKEEISDFLSGGNDFIKPEEAKAIIFAQHYADSRAYPKQYSYDSIVKEYGENKSEIIISAVQIMMVGNIYGIPLSAIISRFKGAPYKDSSLFYELSMLIVGVLYFPLALIHGTLKTIVGFPNKRLDSSPS